MFLTAKEMKRKFCHLLLVKEEGAACESEKCAAWQWGESEDIAHPEARRGFCGLAGVPAEFTLEMQKRIAESQCLNAAASKGLRAEGLQGPILVQPALVPPKKRN